MISKRTVLILGAGASMNYGMPSGAGLRQMILTLPHKLLSRRYVGRSSVGMIPTTAVGEFLLAFRGSQAPSIDSFLEKRPEFLETGRSAIVQCLLPSEKFTLLLDESRSDHWYKYLINAMDAPTFEEFKKNQISFITFNYDRSLEVFLSHAITHRYGVREDEARNAVEGFGVLHVYGHLGSIDPGSENFVPYGAGDGDFEQYAYQAAQGLRLIGEGRNDAEEFKAARKTLETAERVAILGFGFDELNVERLGGREITKFVRDCTGGSLEPESFACSVFDTPPRRVVRHFAAVTGLGSPSRGYDQFMFPETCLGTLSKSLILG